MIKNKMTEYTFRLESTVKVTVYGKNTEENQEKAEKEAILKAKKEIDETDIDCIAANEYTDYEKEYRAQKEAV